MRWSRKFCRGGPTLTLFIEGVKIWRVFFFFDEGSYDPNKKWAIIGPPAKRYLIEFWLGSFVIFQASISRRP